MRYNISWSKWLDMFLWATVNKPKMKAFLRAMITPVILLHNSFLAYNRTVQFDLKLTPQVRKLRWGLNQKFDANLARIYIIDNANTEVDYIFLSSENRPKFLPDYLGANTYDFEVRVPLSLKTREKDIKAFLNAYKLPSKRYILVYE